MGHRLYRLDRMEFVPEMYHGNCRKAGKGETDRNGNFLFVEFDCIKLLFLQNILTINNNLNSHQTHHRVPKEFRLTLLLTTIKVIFI